RHHHRRCDRADRHSESCGADPVGGRGARGIHQHLRRLRRHQTNAEDVLEGSKQVIALDVSASVAGAAYIVAALLFIMSLAGLSKHESSRAGVAYGMVGMAIALVATIWVTFQGAWGQPQAVIGLVMLLVAMLVGAVIGLWRARR